jgi:hypothetical protein
VSTYFFLCEKKKVSKKEKVCVEKSENTIIIFLLYDTNADDADTKENSQNGNGCEYDGLGISQKSDKTAEQRRECDNSQRLAEGFSVCFFVGYLCLMIIVDQISISFINGKADHHEQNGNGEHDNGIEQHNDSSSSYK